MPAFRRNPIYLALHPIRRNAGPFSRQWLVGGMLAPAILAVGANGADANDLTTWTGDENSDWFTADNWDEGVPDNDTRANILSFLAEVEIDNASDTAETSQLTFFGEQLEITADSQLEVGGDLTVASPDTAKMSVSGHLITSGDIGPRIGRFAESADMSLIGTDAEWSHDGSSQISVGSRETASTLEVLDGARLEHDDTQLSVGGRIQGGTDQLEGSVQVSENGSSLSGDRVRVGGFGIGSLEISAGATASHDQAVIADSAHSEDAPVSQGSVVVEDGEWAITDRLEMGRERAIGELTIREGGLVTSGDASIAEEQSGTGIVTVTGDESSWESETLRLGNRGDAELNILEGARMESDGLVFAAVQQGSEASITVDGNDSRLISGSLRIGNSGEADLEITDGGSVSSIDGWIGFNDGGDGTVSVSGPESRWDSSNNLTVGWNGSGELAVESGSEVAVDNNLDIGSNSESGGLVVIEGTDSRIDVGNDLTVGGAGEAGIAVGEGGRLQVQGSSRIGVEDEEGSEGGIFVTGNDSAFDGEGDLRVGQSALGRLSIQDGGRVDVGDTIFGAESTSTFEVELDDDGSHLSTDNLRIGFRGDGTLEVSGGASIDTAEAATISSEESSAIVLVEGNGSRWDIQEQLTVGGDSTTLSSAEGALFIAEEGEVTVGSLDIGLGASSLGTVVVDEGDLESDGSIRLGLQTTTQFPGEGVMVVEGGGNVTSTAGRIVVGFQGHGELYVGDGAEVEAGQEIVVADLGGSSGRLTVNGQITTGEGLVVGSEGELRGDGVVSGDASVQGILAPGNSIGRLAVGDGDLTLEDGSIYRVEVNDGGDEAGVNNDFVTVEGNIVISEEASLHVTSESGTDDGSTYAPETTYNILSAEQEVEGEFSEVTDDFAFLSTSLEYGEDAVFLTLTQIADLANVARTSNQRAVASTLDEQVDDEAMSDITGAVVMMDEDNARAALDDLSGVDHTHTQQIGLRGAQRFRAGLTGRMPGLGGAQAPRETASLEQIAGLQLASAGQPRGLLDEDEDTARGWWVNVEGGRGDIDDTRNASGADYRFTGLTIGFDDAVSNELHLGAAVGYTRNRGDSAGGDIDVDSYHLAAYGGWQRDALYARGSIGVAYHSIDTERFVDTVDRNAEADYSARGLGMRAEGGYAFEVGDTARLTPFGGLDYERLRRSGFSESGAGAANLDVNREREYSLRSHAGVRFEQAFETNNGRVVPYAEAAWAREHGDRSSAMDTAFAADSSTRFTIDGPRLSRDRVRVAAGLDARLNEESFLNVGYQGEIASSDDLHAIGLTFRRNW